MEQLLRFYVRFIGGLALAFLAGMLLVFNLLPTTVRITMGVIGIILIATSPIGFKARPIKKRNKKTQK